MIRNVENVRDIVVGIVIMTSLALILAACGGGEPDSGGRDLRDAATSDVSDVSSSDIRASDAPTDVLASCEDGVQNNDETDVDCGGRDCRPCPDDHTCASDDDCLGFCDSSGICSGSGCSDPTPEVCDGVDNDCDGVEDNGVQSTFYYDGDGDGYGGASTTRACSAPDGYVANSDDCNDGNPAVNPDASESCNGADDDCDNETDEDFANLGGSCTAGTGACESDGVYVCTRDGSSTTCDAPPLARAARYAMASTTTATVRSMRTLPVAAGPIPGSVPRAPRLARQVAGAAARAAQSRPRRSATAWTMTVTERSTKASRTPTTMTATATAMEAAARSRGAASRPAT